MAKQKQFMLSTNDNPIDPFEDFTSWLLFDNEKGYNCSDKVTRIAKFTDDMTDFEENAEIERAIDVIIEHDFMNIYKKVSKDLIIPED